MKSKEECLVIIKTGIPGLNQRVAEKFCKNLAEARKLEKEQFELKQKMCEVIITDSDGKEISHRATEAACLF